VDIVVGGRRGFPAIFGFQVGTLLAPPSLQITQLSSLVLARVMKRMRLISLRLLRDVISRVYVRYGAALPPTERVGTRVSDGGCAPQRSKREGRAHAVRGSRAQGERLRSGRNLKDSGGRSPESRRGEAGARRNYAEAVPKGKERWKWKRQREAQRTRRTANVWSWKTLLGAGPKLTN
jgi:hypothetical protein